MGVRFSAEAEPTKPPEHTQASEIKVNNDTIGSSRSELATNMIRERKHHNIWDYYQLIRLLGEGSIGEVSLVRRKKRTEGGSAYPKKKGIQKWLGCCSDIAEAVATDTSTSKAQQYAVKSIQLSLVNQLYLDELRNEIDVLRSLDHPNIVKAYEVYQTRRNIYVVMEYCSGGDLYVSLLHYLCSTYNSLCQTHILLNVHARAPYTEQEAAALMSQLCSAIAHMHKHDIVHRDLKFENVMFESKNDLSARIKVLDFGLSKKFMPGMSKLMSEGVGTLYTMAPQVLQGIYSSKADCWSLGVIAFVLLSQKKPFAAKTRSKVKDKIMKCDYRFHPRDWDGISKEAKDFVSSLIVYDPTDRSSAKQAMEHPWLNKHADEKTKRTSIEYKKQASLMEHVHDSIIGYARMSELRRIASIVVAHKSSAAEILEIRKAFATYDEDNDGVISLTEFKHVFSQMGYTDDEMKNMFNHLDVNGCNEITFTEFIAATLNLQGRVEEKRLAEAFDLMDDDDSGYISKENLIKLLGKSVPSDRIDSLIKQADCDGDGRVSFSDFICMFREDNCRCCAKNLESPTTERQCTPESEA